MLDYELLYNSDQERGYSIRNNELARMMKSQKDKLHQEVFENIMDLLNKGLLLISKKPVEASVRNAKLIKAFIYKSISEDKPQLGGMDKILAFKSMSDSTIIKYVSKIKSLDEIEHSIEEHLQKKKSEKNHNNTNSESNSDSESETKTKKNKSSKSKSSKK